MADNPQTAAALIPALVLWLFFVVIFGSFIFYQITDTAPARKITLYMDGVMKGEARLAERLEEQIGEPIRMVKIHPFSYVMFGGDELQGADLFIIPDSDLEQFGEWTAPEEEIFIVYDPETGVSVAGDVFLYEAEGRKPETWRLYIGAGSVHLQDGLARKTAEILMETGREEFR